MTNPDVSMSSLYESDAYIVVYINFLPVGDGFEIIDKQAEKSVYLQGPWAESFQLWLDKWKKKAPEQAAVERTLGQFTALAQNPLVCH